MNADCVIVDTNIAFKCLVTGRGDLRERIGPGGHPQLFTPQFLFVELLKHKERLVRACSLPEEDLLTGLRTLLNQLTFIDAHDTPYIALTLHMGGRFWTEDKKLKDALRKQNFDRFFES